MKLSKWTKQDSAEFAKYLRQCTDSQVLGVLDKEQAAGRRACIRLAELEAARRGLL